MKVPLLDLKPQLESLHGEILEAVTRVVESTRYIMGPEIENLEKSFEIFEILNFKTQRVLRKIGQNVGSEIGLWCSFLSLFKVVSQKKNLFFYCISPIGNFARFDRFFKRSTEIIRK